MMDYIGYARTLGRGIQGGRVADFFGLASPGRSVDRIRAAATCRSMSTVVRCPPLSSRLSKCSRRVGGTSPDRGCSSRSRGALVQ